ncbi:MAG: putative lipid II flippase FtsW [Bdellovibrionaceae bacterium]|nr:putative lipid II flippase FtsW [Pseudobdellovibrionaceae bacterium]
MLRALSSNLFLAMLTLVGLGIVQVYSSSYIFAFENYGDGLFFLKKQILFTIIGFVAFFVAFKIRLEWFEKLSWLMWVGATFLVALTLIPGVGVRVGGAIRWIQLPFGFRFEPAELLKLSLVFFMSTILFSENNWISQKSFAAKFVILAAPFGMLLKQPDFGSFMILFVTTVSLLFLSGLSWKWIAGGLAMATPAFYFLVMRVDYRRARIAAFLDPWSDPERKGFQVIQSMLSFHSGGMTGAGLGNGQGKLFFLPEAHTDFTLAVYGEELGFLGLVILMSLYAYIVFRIFQIGILTKSAFYKSICIGGGVLFGLNFLINAGVTMGLFPTKGLTLPFLSYGGSSLVVFMFLFGVLVNIEKNTERSLN